MPSKKGSVLARDFLAPWREQAAKNEAAIKEFMETFSNGGGIEVVKAGASAPSLLGDGPHPNPCMPVAVVQGDKSANYPDLNEPILVLQSSVDIQAKLAYGNLSRAERADKFAKAQEVVIAMRSDDPERTAMRTLAMNQHVEFLRTRKKRHLASAIQNGRTSMTAESNDLLHFAAMHHSRYEITKNLDDLEEAISNVTMAISKAPEARSDLKFLYSNIRGYRLQKYNRTKSVEDLKAVFCTTAAAAADSLKWGNHIGIFDDGDWHREIHNITLLVPIFLRHDIVLPTLHRSIEGTKEWKDIMAKLFDEDTTECLLEVFDNLRLKQKAAGFPKPTPDYQPRYLRTREATPADIYVSKSGDRDSLVNRHAPSTGGTSPANLENPPPSTPHESTLDEPADGGNSDSGSAEHHIPQAEVNDVEEEEITPNLFTRLVHMMSEKRKLDEYMNIRSHPINRAASSSILSCALSKPYINVDYELPIDDVCFKVAVKILDMSRDFHLFSAVQHDPETKLEDIPVSWVPRWDHPRISSYLGATTPDKKWPGKFNRARITQKSEPPKKEILTVPGFLVDKIASSSDLINQDTFEDPNQFVQFWMEITDLKPSLQAGSLQRVEVYQRTLTAGNNFSELWGLVVPELSEEEVKNSFAAFWVRMSDAIRAAGLGDEPPGLNMLPVEELREAAKKANQNAFLDMAEEICRNRRVFRTSKGYLGVGPGILQPDDVVCVLPYKLPFVLRPTVAEHDARPSHAYTHPRDTTSICRRFRLVGECYVDDIMEGKAMNGLEQQNLEIQ